MGTFFNKHILRNILFLFIFISLSANKCNRGYRAIQEEKAKKAAEAIHTKNLLKQILGIKFTEVRRQFDNGLSFSPVGFQLVPEWRISFPSIDSVNIYSPKKGKFLNAPVVFDHDSIFNVAWAWLKLKHLSKDSLRFMVLHVKDNIIQDEKVHVYMTFYANDYIKNVLHSDTGKLWRPSHGDTVYIKEKSRLANTIPDSAYAGTQPALLISKSPLLTIVKEKAADNKADDARSFDDYLLPTYDIVINNAYDDFGYLYSVYVNEKSELVFRKSNQFSYPEFEKSTREAMQGITDGYLKLYLDVKAGKTLGIPHSSIIMLNVTGHKKKG